MGLFIFLICLLSSIAILLGYSAITLRPRTNTSKTIRQLRETSKILSQQNEVLRNQNHKYLEELNARRLGLEWIGTEDIELKEPYGTQE